MSVSGCFPSVPGDENLCSGRGISGAALFQYWCDFDCVGTYQEILNTLPNNVQGYNPNELARVQADVAQLFQTYQQSNTITNNVQDPRFSPFQNTLLELCLDPALPGVCNSFLTTFCAPYTREALAQQPAILNFCGCYAPPDPVYGTSLPGFGCDPYCNRALTIQRANSATGALESCTASVCVISDVNINISESEIGGPVNFANMCSTCSPPTGSSSSTGCICIISGDSVSGNLAQIGVGTQFSQLCGSNSICFEDGVRVACGPAASAPPPIPPTSSTPTIIFIAFIGIITLAILIALFAQHYNR